VLGHEGDPNTLDAAKLFACPAPGRDASAPRIWRLSGTEYRNVLQTVASRNGLPDPFSGANSDQSFANYASAFGMDGITAAQLLDGSDTIGRLMVERMQRPGACLASTTLDAACVRGALGPLGASLFRRPLAADELARYADVVIREQAALGATVALQLGVESLLNSPYFVFRSELGVGAVDAYGRRKLSPYEIASALSLTISAKAPDKTLLDAAAAGALTTPEQLRPHVLRLLEAELAINPRGESSEPRSLFLRFFREWLQYERVFTVFKDPKEFAFHKAPYLFRDVVVWVTGVMRLRKGFLETLLTTNRYDIASPAGFTNKSYSLEASVSGPITLPPEQRAGYLTHPAWLTAFSEADRNDPIRRGKFIRETLLCQSVPKLTIDEIPPIPDMPGATLRERLKKHSESAACASCHALMDPIGFAFEVYDHTARYRTTEDGKPASGAGVLTGAGAQDGPFTGPRQLAEKLAASPVTGQCLTRNVFRFLLGRNESEADACTLAAAYDAYKQSQGDLVELMASILTSDTFIYRTATP
jgi:hypothetical protein